MTAHPEQSGIGHRPAPTHSGETLEDMFARLERALRILTTKTGAPADVLAQVTAVLDNKETP